MLWRTRRCATGNDCDPGREHGAGKANPASQLQPQLQASQFGSRAFGADWHLSRDGRQFYSSGQPCSPGKRRAWQASRATEALSRSHASCFAAGVMTLG